MTVQELNRQPLNRAAALRLEQERETPDPEWLHLLQLAALGLGEAGEESQQVTHLSGFNRAAKAAMRLLESETELTPEEVISLPLPQLSDLILHALTPAPPRD